MSATIPAEGRGAAALRPRDTAGGAFTVLSGAAAALIVLMTAVIVGEVVLHGWQTVTWEFSACRARA